MIIETKLLFFADGLTVNQNLILVKPGHVFDMALLAHEECHQKQMKRIGTFTFWFKYIFSKKFRLESEIEAYCVSIKKGANLESCAWNISNNYMLDLDFRTAKLMLFNKVKTFSEM